MKTNQFLLTGILGVPAGVAVLLSRWEAQLLVLEGTAPMVRFSGSTKDEAGLLGTALALEGGCPREEGAVRGVERDGVQMVLHKPLAGNPPLRAAAVVWAVPLWITCLVVLDNSAASEAQQILSTMTFQHINTSA